MKNVIKYYYNLEPKSIHQINNDFRFIINGIEYNLQRIEYFEKRLNSLYELNNFLLKNGVYCHQIILNMNNEFVTVVNNIPYILIKFSFPNREINYNDIKFFSNLIIENNAFLELNNSDWHNLWIKKTDYIEYQINQLGVKYPIIRKSVNYYIGMAETALAYLLTAEDKERSLVVAHRRICSKIKTNDLYNPINFILDVRIRDLSEYCKNNFFISKYDFENIKKNILDYKMSSDEAILFIARMFFPTYYFDCYHEILLGNLEEKELLKYVNKVDEYQLFLKRIYIFLKNYYNIPEIEWIL